MSTLDPAVAQEPAQEPAPAVEAEPNRWSRWSDHLNPILVREVQQSLKGRVFAFSVIAALMISAIIAVVVAGDPSVSERGGRRAFESGLATLVPLLIFIVPMQAYQSMRMEMRGGIQEQLLLSRLRPSRIVLGKLAAAMVQFGLYVSVMAPLLATSYLLRGVDLPTIALSLLFGMMFCVTATAFAISSAAQGALPAMQGLANLAVAVGLGMASFGFVGFVLSGTCLRTLGWLLTSADFGAVTSLVVLSCGAGAVLSSLVAQAFLAHGFENRSTPFRIFLFATIAVSLGWMLVFARGRLWDEFTVVVTTFLALLGAAFAVFMTTEQADLSPRVRAHAPKSRLVAMLATPFLPGRHRGMLCMLLYFAVIAAVMGPMWAGSLSSVHPYAEGTFRMVVMIACYTVIYCSLGCGLRARLPASIGGNHMARVAIPLMLFLFCLLPLVLDLFVKGGVDGYHLGHLMNPFFTIGDRAWSARGDEVVKVLLVLAAVCIAIHVPNLLRGVREVMDAQLARRARAAEERVVA